MEKGMSQTVTLIVTATVVLMAALIVIYMARGSLGDVLSSSNAEKCISSAQAKCQFGSAGEGSEVTVPSCGTVENTPSAGSIDGVESISGSSVTCSG